MNQKRRSQMLEKLNGSKSFSVNMEKISSDSELIIGSFDIPVTTRCTLRCRNCSSLIPYYRKPSDFEIESVIKSLMNILNAVDYIIRINVLGGEPFLHRELDKLLHVLNGSEKIEKVRVITNGTVPPQNERIISELKNAKMKVRISHYNLGNRNVDQLVKILEDNKIAYSYKEFGINDFQWFDFGSFQCRNRDHKTLIQQKKRCDVEWYSLLNGRLYCCPRAAHAENLGIIPSDKLNSIDFSELKVNRAEQIEEILDFVLNTGFYPACQYCDRGTGLCKTVKVAEQCNE